MGHLKYLMVPSFTMRCHSFEIWQDKKRKKEWRLYHFRLQVTTASSKPIKSTTKLVLFYLCIFKNKAEAINEIRTVDLFFMWKKFKRTMCLSSTEETVNPQAHSIAKFSDKSEMTVFWFRNAAVVFNGNRASDDTNSSTQGKMGITHQTSPQW